MKTKRNFFKNTFLGIVAFTLLSTTCFAIPSETTAYGPKGRRFGAGIIAGEPTGISLRGYVSSRVALDLIASWSFLDDALTLIGDVTYDFFDIPVNTNSFSLPFYAGAGGILGFGQRGKNDGRTIVGVRVPVGVAMQFINHPVEVFFEVAPGVQLAPSTKFDITGGIGVRYYFF